MGTVAELTLVWHGQSLANVAFADAHARGLADHGLAGRDGDIELSPLGWEQASRLGRWFAAPARSPPARRCHLVPLRPCSADLVTSGRNRGAARRTVPHRLCRLPLVRPAHGRVGAVDPSHDQSTVPSRGSPARSRREFSYRPPGGESFGDIARRLAAVLSEMNTRHAGRRVLLVAHDAVVVVMRHLIDGLGFDEIAVIVATTPVATSITRYDGTGGGLTLVEFATTTHLESVKDDHTPVGE